MSKIPEYIREVLEFGLGGLLNGNPYKIKTYPNEMIEGVSIETGTVGNSMPKQVKDFVVENTTKDYLIVCENTESDVLTWGDMAIAFESLDEAEKFRDLVRESNGSLRLEAQQEGSEWFYYEAE